jgi:outer membrane lipoprotein-sorting protein
MVRKIYIIVLLCALIASIFSNEIEMVGNKFLSMPSFSADIRLLSTDNSSQSCSTGKLYFNRPNALIQFDNQVFLLRDKLLYTFTTGESDGVMYPMGNIIDLTQNPLSRLSKKYAISVDTESNLWIVDGKANQDEMLAEFRITIDKTSGIPQSFEWTSFAGVKTGFALENVKVEELSTKLFKIPETVHFTGAEE